MTATTATTDQDKSFVITTSVSFSTVVELRQQIEHYIESCSHNAVIDWSQASAKDSSGLTLMLCLKRYAEQHSKIITFTDVPSSLTAIARLCRITHLLMDE